LKGAKTEGFEVHRPKLLEDGNDIKPIGTFERNPKEPAPKAVDRLLQMLGLLRLG
jgi:hypothetical protein